MELPKVKEDVKDRLLSGNNPRGILAITAIQGLGGIAVLHQLDKKIIYHYDFKHLTEKYFEIGMKLRNDKNIISNISVTVLFLMVIWGNGIIEHSQSEKLEVVF